MHYIIAIFVLGVLAKILGDRCRYLESPSSRRKHVDTVDQMKVLQSRSVNHETKTTKTHGAKGDLNGA